MSDPEYIKISSVKDGEQITMTPFTELMEALDDPDLRERVDHLGAFCVARYTHLMEENDKLLKMYDKFKDDLLKEPQEIFACLTSYIYKQNLKERDSLLDDQAEMAILNMSVVLRRLGVVLGSRWASP